MKRKIIIAGANGFIGRYLARWLAGKGDEVVALVRTPGTAPESAREVLWDGEVLGSWAAELEGADAVVNLAGRSVNCRYHARNRARIFESRTASTRILGEAIALAADPPEVWINSSTATIYRHAEDGPQDEYHGELGGGFSVEVAKAWEKAFYGARVPGGVRKVALRTSLVLAREPDTVFDYFWKIARLGLGGPMGSGNQRISWVHIADFCRAVEWIMERPDFEGVANVAAPEVPTNREFMAAMRGLAGVPFGLPARRWMLSLGTWVCRTEAELVLKSRWVRSARLSRAGFEFRYARLAQALADLAPVDQPVGAPAPAKNVLGTQ